MDSGEISAPAPVHSAWINVVTGGMSGMLVDFFLFPLDTIKTRLQARHVVGAVLPTKWALYRGEATVLISDAITLRQRGSCYFPAGLLSAMAVSFPGAAMYWTVYEAVKKTTAPTNSASGPHSFSVDLNEVPRHALCASIAETTTLLVRNPFEVGVAFKPC
jgi:hypothetical protein